ncbi:hypothetical protein C448_03144 [Halococcus morrhuae DSM 1307]|uniref:Uncharacterized protein n=1 Tax=Halococcus morrhuae DSM 1307 TaxID=931277 RepID=M0MVU9_HALMO|nr:hypothetical protein [Halococcus morrhuae]EMA48535.1 hypothetical protein C448_03144 [Halococcus morrhuae DSM 1307]
MSATRATQNGATDGSIHQHNAHAERVATVGQLRSELDEAAPADD